MKEKLRDILFHLRNRSKMYLLGNDSYSSLVCFLIGFGEGVKENGQNVLSDFDFWLQAKVGRNYSFHWSSYILEEMCQKEEKKAKKELIELLTEFCKEG